MDWMDKSMVTSEISLLLERMDQERGRVYWRSFSENVHIPPLVWLNATKVRLGNIHHHVTLWNSQPSEGAMRPWSLSQVADRLLW